MNLEVQKRDNPFNTLPLELRGRIIKDVFNLIVHEDKRVKSCIDQKKLEKYTLRVPTWLGIECIQEFRQLQKICQNKIGEKTILPHQLFVLERKYRDAFIRMANRHWIRSELEGNTDRVDFETLMAIEDKDIKKNLYLNVVRGGKSYYFALAAMVTFSSSIFILSVFASKFSQYIFVQLVRGAVICLIPSCFLTVFMCVIYRFTHLYDERCYYDNFGQLRSHYRFQNGKYEEMSGIKL